jgi:hypothetical protein
MVSRKHRELMSAMGGNQTLTSGSDEGFSAGSLRHHVALDSAGSAGANT